MEYRNKKGQTYYLHKKQTIIGKNKVEVTTYFFRKIKTEGYTGLPIGYTVSETKTGLPVVKKLSS